MSSKIATIQDDKGDVYTGREVEESAASHAAGLIAGIATLGLSELMSPDTTTVEVNGERHTGTRVDSK